MKNYYVLIGLLFSIATYGQQTMVFQETFETGSVFTASEDCADGVTNGVVTGTLGYDFFIRTTSGGGPNGADGTRIRNKNVYKNPEGAYFWAAQDINGCGESRDVETLEKTGIDITGKTTNLRLVLLAAEDDKNADTDIYSNTPLEEHWDNDTHVFVEVKIDGGSYVKVLQFSAGADGSTDDNTEPKLDTNLDGTGDDIAVTNTFQEFIVNLTDSLTIPTTATTLDLKITFDKLSAGEEDFAIDNIRIVQNYVAQTAPVISGGDTASANVPENTTAVTTVMATDANSGTTIGYSIDDSSPDASKFTITTKADGTGADLTFTYAPDFETPASSLGTNEYMVVVRVNSGIGTALCCKTQAITVTVTDDVNEVPATEEVVFQETFETGSVFTASEDCYDNPLGYDYFTRTTSGHGLANGTKIKNKNVYKNPQGSYFWAAQDINGCGESRDTETLEKTGIDITGKTNLSLVLLVAEDDEDLNDSGDVKGEKWDENTLVYVEIKIDGGTYTKVLQFAAGPDTDMSAATNSDKWDEEPKLDTNLDGTGDGTAVTNIFQEFTVDLSSFSGLTISSSASTLDLKITFDNLETGGEDIAIDNIRIIASSSTMSLDENTITSSVRIYPNPSGDFILLPNITGKYSVYNISGKEVLKGTISANKKIDIRNLVSGLYFLKLNNTKTLKFLKK